MLPHLGSVYCVGEKPKDEGMFEESRAEREDGGNVNRKGAGVLLLLVREREMSSVGRKGAAGG